MSGFGPPGGGRAPRGLLSLPRGEVIARYESYLGAQRAVDFLSDEKFDVRQVSIIGTDLRMVERVTGRLTYGRVAVVGASSGAWFGLLIGAVLSLFASEGSGATLFGAVVLGAGFGIVFSVISYALTGGRRDFTSMSQILAAEYHVLCSPEAANDAIAVLHRLPGGLGDDPRPPAGPGAAAPVTGLPPAPTTPPAPVQPDPPVVEPETPPTGPTYGEMIDKQRRERQEREAAEAAARAAQPPES